MMKVKEFSKNFKSYDKHIKTSAYSETFLSNKYRIDKNLNIADL